MTVIDDGRQAQTVVPGRAPDERSGSRFRGGLRLTAAAPGTVDRVRTAPADHGHPSRPTRTTGHGGHVPAPSTSPEDESPGSSRRPARDTADQAGHDGAEHIFLVASSGGHLAQLLALRPWWDTRQRTWVTFDTPDARSQLEGESIIIARHPTTRNIPNLLRNSVMAARLMRRTRPSLIVSTGAAVAFPFFLYAKLMRVPTVYVEVFDRVESRTLTGRLCRPLATEFLVQWEQQLALYKGARVIGTLL